MAATYLDIEDVLNDLGQHFQIAPLERYPKAMLNLLHQKTLDKTLKYTKKGSTLSKYTVSDIKKGTLDPGNLDGKMKLVDMGYVDGNIGGKKLHCYYVVYGAGIGNSYDHIYILEDGMNISIYRGSEYNRVSVINPNDTLELK